MEYKKIKEPAYNIHFIKTDKFKKIRIKINFKEELKKENIVIRNMLSLILLESSKKYPTKRLLDIECEELYNVGISSNTSISGNYHILSFQEVFLNELYTEKNMNELSFQFFLNLILDPNIVDNMFTLDAFNNAKKCLEEDIMSFGDVPARLALSNLYKNMCPNTPLELVSCGYLEDLNNVTRESLYEYDKNMIKSNLIDIFVVGNFNDDEMLNIIKKNMTINTIKKQNLSHFIKQDKIRNRPQTVIDEKDLNQSIMIMGFKIKDLTDFERVYVLSIYNAILGGSPDSKLFKQIREKHSLCYSISSSYSGISNLQFISAGIDKDNFKKCVNLIKKEVKKMENGDFSEEQINQAIITYKASLREIEDTPSSMISIYEAHEYLNYDLIDKREENISKVTKEMIINTAKKIKLDTIYLLKGVENERN